MKCKLTKTDMTNMEKAAASFAVYPTICMKGSKKPFTIISQDSN